MENILCIYDSKPNTVLRLLVKSQLIIVYKTYLIVLITYLIIHFIEVIMMIVTKPMHFTKRLKN